MITEQIQIKYRLTFTSAFHLGTGLREGLIHRAVAKDADGYLYVPGSSLKGALRERCEQLANMFGLQSINPHAEDLAEANPDVDIVTRIFGSRFQPGRLYFDDAYLPEKERQWFEPPYSDNRMRDWKRSEFRAWQTEKRTQVGISRLTRTAEPGLLYNSEYGTRGLQFDGQIVGMLNGFAIIPGEAGTYSLLLLLAGLKSLNRIGGNKSDGAGQVTCEITNLTVNGQALDHKTLLNKLEDLELYWIVREEAAG